MKNKRNLPAVICIALLVLCLNSASCSAATASWSLRYVKGGPAAVQVESWSKTVTTKATYTTISATAISNGAEVFVYTDNGIASIFSTASATAVKTKTGITVYASVKFSKHGTANNKPAGRLTY